MSYWFSETNFVASASLSVSSQAEGIVGYPLKEGLGAAAAVSDGSYTGSGGVLYRLEIDSVSAGKEIGQATFRWKRSDSASGWEESGRATSESVAVLDRGVKVRWIGGTGDDLELGDRWIIETNTPFGPAGLADLNRDTAFRSGGLDGPTWIRADLGSAKRVRACFIMDHNFTSEAALTLQANGTDEWTTPAYEQSLTHHEAKIGLFLDQTYRYWRLTAADASNPDGYLEIGEFFLGQGLDSGLLLPGSQEMGLDGSELNWTPRTSFSGVFVAPSLTVLEGLMDWYAGLLEADKRRLRPFIFCLDKDDPSPNSYLMRFVNQNLNHVQIGPGSYRIQIGLIELERSDV